MLRTNNFDTLEAIRHSRLSNFTNSGLAGPFLREEITTRTNTTRIDEWSQDRTARIAPCCPKEGEISHKGQDDYPLTGLIDRIALSDFMIHNLIYASTAKSHRNPVTYIRCGDFSVALIYYFCGAICGLAIYMSHKMRKGFLVAQLAYRRQLSAFTSFPPHHRYACTGPRSMGSRHSISSEPEYCRNPYLRHQQRSISSSTGFAPNPAPEPLPEAEQRIFEKLQKASRGAFSGSLPLVKDEQTQDPTRANINFTAQGSGKTEDVEERVHPHVRKGARPEFEGERNPRTGEVGGPKSEPLRWGGQVDWSYNGRVTDF